MLIPSRCEENIDMRGTIFVNTQQWSRKKSWCVGIGTALCICLVLTLGALSLNNRHKPVWQVTPSPVTSQSPATAETQAVQDETALGVYLAQNGPAYLCADGRNRQAKYLADLVVCPRYTAKIDFKGNTADHEPVIHNAVDNSGTPMITITYRLHQEERISEMTGTRYFYSVWVFKVNYHASVFPAGRNEQYRTPLAGRNSQWAGLIGVGTYFTNEFGIPDEAIAHEIYGADKFGAPGKPLNADRYLTSS